MRRTRSVFLGVVVGILGLMAGGCVGTHRPVDAAPRPSSAAGIVPLGSPGLSVGVPGAGFTIPGGTLALAVVTPAAGSTGDTRRWIALKTQIDGGVFDGIPGLRLSATNLTVELNVITTSAKPSDSLTTVARSSSVRAASARRGGNTPSGSVRSSA